MQLHLGGEDQFFELLAVAEGEKAGKLHVLWAEAGKGEGHLADIQEHEAGGYSSHGKRVLQLVQMKVEHFCRDDLGVE